MNSNKQATFRVADADESTSKIDFRYFDRKYKEWLIRRGFADELGNPLGMRHSNVRRVKSIKSDEL